MQNRLITITGPTASGKTALAAALASRINGEIISGDSRQVYRRMDIGTGKDLADYVVNGKRIPVHLIDICEPGEKYNVFSYRRDFFNAFDDVTARGCQPILCGGSGLYIEAVLRDYDMPDVPQNPELRQALADKTLSELSDVLAGYRPLHNTTDTDTVQRAIRAIEIEEYRLHNTLGTNERRKPDGIIFCIDAGREERRRRITERLKARLNEGMIDEVKNLLDGGLQPDDLIYYGLEYKYVTLYVTGRLSYDEMFSLLETAIHRFAKRQMTWFRGMERRGCTIHHIDAALPQEEKLMLVLSYVQDK
jgi:tRNA dimethylallyltransferase